MNPSSPRSCAQTIHYARRYRQILQTGSQAGKLSFPQRDTRKDLGDKSLSLAIYDGPEASTSSCRQIYLQCSYCKIHFASLFSLVYVHQLLKLIAICCLFFWALSSINFLLLPNNPQQLCCLDYYFAVLEISLVFGLFFMQMQCGTDLLFSPIFRAVSRSCADGS